MGYDLKTALENEMFVESLNKNIGAVASTLATVEGQLKPVKQLIFYKSIEENPTSFELKFNADTDEFLGGLVLKIKKDIDTAENCIKAIRTGLDKLMMKKISQSIGKEMLDTTLKDKVTYRPVFKDKKLHFKVTKAAMPSSIIKLLQVSDFEEKKVAQLLKIFGVSVPHLREYLEFLTIMKGQDKASRLIKLDNDIKTEMKAKQKVIKTALLGDVKTLDIAFWKGYCELTKLATTGDTEDRLNRVIGGILLKLNQFPGGKIISQIAAILKTYPNLLAKRADYKDIQSKVFLGKMMRKKTESFFIMKSSDKTLYNSLLLNSLTEGDQAKLKKQVDALIGLVDNKLDGYTKYLTKQFAGKNIKPLVKEINFLTNEIKIKYVKDNKSVKEQTIKLNIAS